MANRDRRLRLKFRRSLKQEKQRAKARGIACVLLSGALVISSILLISQQIILQQLQDAENASMDTSTYAYNPQSHRDSRRAEDVPLIARIAEV
jgi:hypothetical protein